MFSPMGGAAIGFGSAGVVTIGICGHLPRSTRKLSTSTTIRSDETWLAHPSGGHEDKKGISPIIAEDNT
jgi:hypothetical protein